MTAVLEVVIRALRYISLPISACRKYISITDKLSDMRKYQNSFLRPEKMLGLVI